MNFEKWRARAEKRDVIYREKIHADEEREEVLPKKGIVDVPMLLITAALLLFGCVMVYSASSIYAEQYHDDTTYFIARHLFFILAGVGVAALAAAVCTPRFWKDWSYLIFGISVVLLLLVPIIGVDLNSGAKRWLDLYFFTLQPSEIAKMALVLTLARFMTTHEKKILSEHRFGGSFKYGVLFPGLLIFTVVALVAIEKHISGVMIIGMIGIAVMFLGGTKLRWIISVIGFIVGAGCLLILVSEYAQTRVLTWWNIEDADPLGSAWQTLQGLMAIGSGGVFGTGLGNSRQKFGYVSQPQNDFIYTIVCEELGFIGAALVVLLFIAFVWRGFYIAKHLPDKCSALMVYGLSFKVALQVILNIAVVTNMMPNTGIALPFFSYGGTSLILQLLEVGIILSMSRYASHRKI